MAIAGARGFRIDIMINNKPIWIPHQTLNQLRMLHMLCMFTCTGPQHRRWSGCHGHHAPRPLMISPVTLACACERC
jgi:hypothetical protein